MIKHIEQRLETLYADHDWLARARPALELIVSVGGLLGFYYILEAWMRESAHLPAAAYDQPVIAVGLLQRLVQDPAPLLVIAAISLIGRRGLWRRWIDLEHGHILRGLMLIVAGVAAWTFATYDYNLYFDQAHYLDRLLLIALAALAAWRPVFVLPLTGQLFAVGWQFDYPLIGAYPWTEMSLLLRALSLFGAAFLIVALTGRQMSVSFVFVLVCLIAAQFWSSGLGKFELRWFLHPYLHLLILGAYANGWLNVIPPAGAVAFSELAANFNWPLIGFTLFVEWGAMFILVRRGLTRLLLASLIVFHAGIFLYTGMLFWKWMVLEAAMLALLTRRRWLADLPIYTPAHAVLSLAVVGAGPALFHPANLSWYDTNASYIYEFRGVGQSGAVHSLPKSTFTPYSDTFTLNIFSYVSRTPQLTRLWDIALDRAMARRLLAVASPEELFALEAQSGYQDYDAVRAGQLDDFLVRFFGHLNRRGFKTTPFSYVQAPSHLWTLPRGAVFAGQEPIVRVQVVQVTWLYANHETRPIRERVVHEVEIPPAGGGRP